jgi:hypothetical protein
MAEKVTETIPNVITTPWNRLLQKLIVTYVSKLITYNSPAIITLRTTQNHYSTPDGMSTQHEQHSILPPPPLSSAAIIRRRIMNF